MSGRSARRVPGSRCARALAVVAVMLAMARAAHADEPPGDPTKLTWKYAYDGGALPFVYGAAAVYVGLPLVADPRGTPLGFSPNEGGAPVHGDTVATWMLGANQAAAVLTVALVPDRSRWFHAKGLVEAWFTTAALTQTTKHAFGRHRPDFDLTGDNSLGEHKSFFSGHAATTLAQTTYLGLYLRYHGFDRARGGRVLPWWECATYGGLAAVSFYVPYSRVADNRHFVSDVVVGSAVGAATAAAFFFWQEGRYRRASSPLGDVAAPPRAMVLPDLEHRGIQLVFGW